MPYLASNLIVKRVAVGRNALHGGCVICAVGGKNGDCLAFWSMFLLDCRAWLKSKWAAVVFKASASALQFVK